MYYVRTMWSWFLGRVGQDRSQYKTGPRRSRATRHLHTPALPLCSSRVDTTGVCSEICRDVGRRFSFCIEVTDFRVSALCRKARFGLLPLVSLARHIVTFAIAGPTRTSTNSHAATEAGAPGCDEVFRRSGVWHPKPQLFHDEGVGDDDVG